MGGHLFDTEVCFLQKPAGVVDPDPVEKIDDCLSCVLFKKIAQVGFCKEKVGREVFQVKLFIIMYPKIVLNR